MSKEELDIRFTYHVPKGDQAIRYVKIRDLARTLAETICDLSPECREQSLAITSLEEAVMWANAGIARRE